MTNPGLEIRPIQPGDVPALLTIIADSRREYGMDDRGVELLEPADLSLYDTYHHQRTLYFVALLGGEVVGGAGVSPLAGADPLTCELQRMYLRRDARGRGIGDALLQRCLAAAKQFLYVRCYLETITEMHAALEFYGRHGSQDLKAPLGRTGHEHSDRWLMRPLRASARHSLGDAPGQALAAPC